MIFDPTPPRSAIPFIIAGCVVVGTVIAGAMTLQLLATI